MIDGDDQIDNHYNTTTILFTNNNQCHPSTLQKYHQKITTATVSNVPINELHECKSLSISTLNLTQDIQSKETEDDNVSEIIVNRVYETDVQNKTFILKKSRYENRIPDTNQMIYDDDDDDLSESFPMNSNGKQIDDKIIIDRFEPIIRLSCSSDINHHHQISRAFTGDYSPFQSCYDDKNLDNSLPQKIKDIPFNVINSTTTTSIKMMTKPVYSDETISELTFPPVQQEQQQQQQSPTNDNNDFSEIINTDNINKPFSTTSYHLFDSVPIDLITSFPLTISDKNVSLQTMEHSPVVQVRTNL